MLARHVTLQIDASPLLIARGDRVQLQQVLLNLLVNGADAMSAVPPGERRLFVQARPSGHDTLEIAVTDNGHGIPEENLASLFEPFATTKSSGLGLGLAISKTIVESHGGSLWAENNPGAGATFRFTLKTGGNGSQA